MPQLESEIFNNYVKISEEAGLVSEADYAEARRGSDTEETIRLLYNVKPNGENTEMRSLVEQAHPESVVIAPAHDKMNSLLENVIERQNIMGYIANKMPTGNHTMHRYVSARTDLTGSLVRAAMMLDNKEEEDLMKLADSCNERLNKTGMGGVAIAWIIAAAIGSVLAGSALYNRTSDSAQGVVNNAQAVLDQLTDISHIQGTEAIVKDITDLQTLARQFIPAQKIMFSREDPMTLASTHSAELSVTNKYYQKLQDVSMRVESYKSSLEAMVVAEDQSMDWWQKTIDVGREILSIPTDVEDVIRAFEGLQKSIIKELNAAQRILAKVGQAKPQLEQYVHQRAQQAGGIEKLPGYEMLSKRLA